MPPGMNRDRSAMNALQKHVIQHSPSPKEQMAVNVARHYVNQLYSEVDGDQTENTLNYNDQENILNAMNQEMQQNTLVGDQKEGVSKDKEEEDDNSNILNKSIAEIQSIINNISFFPQNKGECVNNSDITSMSVDSNAKEQSNTSSSSKTTTKQGKGGTAPHNQKLQLPPLVESQYNY